METETKRSLREADVHVRLAPEEKRLLALAAKREGRNLANFLRYHGLAAARLYGPHETKEVSA